MIILSTGEASCGISVATTELVTWGCKATMKKIKGPATSNNSTIKFMTSSLRIASLLIEFRAVKPFSLGITKSVEITPLRHHLSQQARKCHFSATKIIKLIKEKEVSTE